MAGGWGGSNRSDTLPPDWDQRVAAVRARSGGRCEWKIDPKNKNYRRCPNDADGGVDHYKGRLNHDIDALRDSCHRHHSRKSSQEGNAGKAAKAALRYRPKEEHPGMIKRS